MKGNIRQASSADGALHKAKAASIAASGALVLLTPLCAIADASTSASPLEEVVVTAQKRSENVQDIPASVTALSATMLEDRQIREITDLSQQVPSMEVGQYYGANLITLRGISTGLTVGTEDPSVAVHVNGVYQPRSRSLDVALMDMERVEVLAGPQGTLYGRNATGGVVNYILKGPTKEFEGEVTGLVANYDRYGIRGSVSGPISDTVGFRLSGVWDDQQTGFSKNLVAGAPNKTLEAPSTAGGRAALSFQPIDSLRFDFDAMYVQSKTSISSFAFGPSNSAAVAAITAPQTFEAHKIYTSWPAKLNGDFGLYSLTASWDINSDVNLKSITAYQTYKDEQSIDNSASAFTAVAVDTKNDDHTFTQELDLTAHAFSNRLTSVYGFYYFDDHINIYTEVPFNIAPPPNYYIFTPNNYSAKSYAVFTDQTLQIADRWRLIAGVRYNRDEKTAENGLTIVTVGPVCHFKDTNKWTATTPRFGVQFDVTDGVMSYAGWQKGFKAGGYTANTCGDPFEPESIEGPEIGIKSQLFDNHLRLNAAAYYYDYKNLQVQQEFGVAQYGTTNAAASRIKGIEMSALGTLDNGLSADLAMNFQSAEYTKFSNCNLTPAIDACTTPESFLLYTEDVSGNRLNRAPPYTVNLGINYEVDMSAGSLLFRGESYWSGEVNFDEFATKTMTQPAYSVQNLYVTYTSSNQKYVVRAFAKNVTDEEYKIAAFWNSAQGQPGGSWAPPRTFGAEASVRF